MIRALGSRLARLWAAPKLDHSQANPADAEWLKARSLLTDAERRGDTRDQKAARIRLQAAQNERLRRDAA